MKLNAVAAAMSAAMLTGNVHAEDIKEASPSVPDKLPTFTVSFFLMSNRAHVWGYVAPPHELLSQSIDS